MYKFNVAYLLCIMILILPITPQSSLATIYIISMEYNALFPFHIKFNLIGFLYP